MLVRFLCPSGHQLIARPDMFGEKAQCPVCFQLLVVPIRNPRSSGRNKKSWDADDPRHDEAPDPAPVDSAQPAAAPDFVPTDAFVPVPEPTAASRSSARGAAAPAGSTSYFPPLPPGLGTVAAGASPVSTTASRAAVMSPPETKPAAPAWKPAPLRLAPGATEPPALESRTEPTDRARSGKKSKKPKEPRVSTTVAPRAPLMPPGSKAPAPPVPSSSPLPQPTPPSAYAPPPPSMPGSEDPTLDLPKPTRPLGLQIQDAPPPAPPSTFYEPPRTVEAYHAPPAAAPPPSPSPDVPLPLPPSAFTETAYAPPLTAPPPSDVPFGAPTPSAPELMPPAAPADPALESTTFFQESRVEATSDARVAPALREAPPPASVAFEPTNSQRLSGAITALALIVTAIVMVWPALSIYTAEGATPGWAKVVMAIFGVQVLYSLLLAALPDWSVFWLGMIWQTLVAAVHALAWALLSFGPKEGALTFHLETVRSDGPTWCLALGLAALAGALVCRKFCRSGRIAFELEKAELERRRAAVQRA